ncbi:MAG: hypothetical protein P4L92_23090 [Rudaea sp.]|nr:hypothetical protein [Rudaea sp.]
MLLLTMNQWLGPGVHMAEPQRSAVKVMEGLIAFATELPLADALQRIKEYERAFNGDRTSLGMTLSLIGVTTVDAVALEIFNSVNVRMVETLPKSRAEI